MQTYEHLYVGGRWTAPAGSDFLDVVSPATEEVVARVPDPTEEDIDRAVASARDAFDNGPWPRMSPSERADTMERISKGLEARIPEMAQTITREMGSPIGFSMAGKAFAPKMVLDYYTGLAREFAFEEPRAGALGGRVLVRREPVGVCGLIVPWNVPLYVTMLKLSPALAAGCTAVVKAAPETPLNGYLLAEIASEAGLPEGVLSILHARREPAERLVVHPDVDKIGFTGSTAAGKRIAGLCGQQLKRFTLELGGKSAAIVCDDADLDEAVPQLLPGALMNSGQACIAQTRILASKRRYSEVVEALVEHVGAMRVGDPLDEATGCGPLFAERQRERVEGYIGIGRDEGAEVALGGGRPEGLERGWYVEPTVFTGVDNRMRIAREEIFGPVLAVIPYEDEDDAVRIANDSDYGLSGSVWTPDIERGTDVARRVRTGTYGVNQVGMDFGAPFGGFKQSGIGRELGPEGLSAYLEAKTILLPA